MGTKLDGNWMDEMGTCKVCGGEIPHGHTNNCDIWKLERDIEHQRKQLLSSQASIEKIGRVVNGEAPTLSGLLNSNEVTKIRLYVKQYVDQFDFSLLRQHDEEVEQKVLAKVCSMISERNERDAKRQAYLVEEHKKRIEGKCCILDVDSPTLPASDYERWQCRCRQCVTDLRRPLVEALEKLPNIAYKVIFEHEGDVNDLPNTLQCIVDATLREAEIK